MSVNLGSHYAKQYANTIMLLLQQQGSRLRGKVTEHTGYRGEQVSPVDQVGKVEMQPIASRFSPMGRVDAEVDRRWLVPAGFELPQLLSPSDELRMITDPQGKWVQNAVNAAGRRIDRTIIAAFFGTALTGKEGGTSTSFSSDTGGSVAVNFQASSDVSLSVAKLREAKRLLMAADVDVDTEELYCGVTATEHDALLAETQVISGDYNSTRVLVDGKITRFMGFNFVHSELFGETLSSGDHQIPVWAKSGMHLGLWEDYKTSISTRNDLSDEPTQVYLKMTLGATRLEGEKIVKILCNI